MNNISIIDKLNHLSDDHKNEVNAYIDALLKKDVTKSKKQKPKYGCLKGKIWLAPDFNEPLDDFKEYMK